MGDGTERWEHFAHGADVGIRGRGPTPAAAFSQAAVATSAVVADLATIEARESVRVVLHGANLEDLLFDWLDAIVLEMSANKRLFGRFEVTIEDGTLEGTLWGERVEPARHQPAVEVKGPTYTELRVYEDPTDRIWVAQCVVDV